MAVARESRREQKVGAPPGTLIHFGERKLENTRLTVTHYGPDELTETEADLPAACAPPREGAVTWINVEGLHDVEVVREVGDCHGLHRLVIEDILDTNHRPKLEDYGEYLYLVTRHFWYDEAGEMHSEQLSLMLGRGLVITFCEGGRDVLDPIRSRLRMETSRLRSNGADYLAYAILDTVVDGYFAAMDGLGENIEAMEARLLKDPDQQVLREIHRAKRQTALIRKAAWPMREAISRLEHEDAGLIAPATALFIRDAYDHIIQIVDTLESFRDMLSSMLDTYLSSISNRMNEVMKVLTIIATIFIPITFIAGVYGMNFEHMPELGYWWAYPATLGLMIAVGLGMLVYFRRRRWI